MQLKNILANFVNPWEAATEVLKTSVLDSKVLETKVLETGVLEGSVLEKFNSKENNGVFDTELNKYIEDELIPQTETLRDKYMALFHAINKEGEIIQTEINSLRLDLEKESDETKKKDIEAKIATERTKLSEKLKPRSEYGACMRELAACLKEISRLKGASNIHINSEVITSLEGGSTLGSLKYNGKVDGIHKLTISYASQLALFKAGQKMPKEATVAHELKHAYQFLQGKLMFHRKGKSYEPGPLYDIIDEVEAFRRQTAFQWEEEVTPIEYNKGTENFFTFSILPDEADAENIAKLSPIYLRLYETAEKLGLEKEQQSLMLMPLDLIKSADIWKNEELYHYEDYLLYQ